MSTGTTPMGRDLVPATIENLDDLILEDQRFLEEPVRSIDVEGGLVDTGATLLSLPKSMIERLGLRCVREHHSMTAAGKRETRIFQAVRLTVQDRRVATEVAELPDDCPVLIGQIPLEQLDFVVDPRGQKLIGNPEHDGEWMIELWTHVD
jgi:predicted aspartyl protease